MIPSCNCLHRSVLLWSFLATLLSLTQSWQKSPSVSLLSAKHSLHSRSRRVMSSSNAEPSTVKEDSSKTDREPVWDPVAQIYVGGVVPGEHAALQAMIAENGGALRLFGYGSLCWNPGTGPLAQASVQAGKAYGYRRCWAQRSTDHRGFPSFPGIVCTLLRQEEVQAYRQSTLQPTQDVEAFAEGLVYTVPPELVDECLAELDFREKGGYAREVINVVLDDDPSNNNKTLETVQALLYRGTPDNPAFWKRALVDLPFASAVMSVAVGPSGLNTVYLNRLDEFLQEHQEQTASVQLDDDTVELASMVRALKNDFDLYFLSGSGSNQHNQLFLDAAKHAADLVNDEDAHDMKEIVLCTPKRAGASSWDPPIGIFCGGGHSAVLTQSGRAFFFGWNESGQLGTSGIDSSVAGPLPVLRELQKMCVDKVALGFSHSLVLERETGRIFAFGDNSRSQCTATANGEEKALTPVLPILDEVNPAATPMVDIAAGLFHSAAITREGYLVTFGCRRFGQSLSPTSGGDEESAASWQPDDKSRLLRVACGRRHTVVLDERGRVWSLGDNKYGQLGRRTTDEQRDSVPGQIELEEDGVVPFDIACGWSHTVILAKDRDGEVKAFGCGRNDKGQLGTGSMDHIATPIRVFENHRINAIDCGSESTILVTDAGELFACGWNEHGNLATGNTQDALQMTKVSGSPIVTMPGLDGGTRLCIAAGGAHLLVMNTATAI